MPVPHTLVVEAYSLLTSACVAGLWQGAALALMAAALLRLMPRASANLRHTVLVAVFAITAVLPWLRFDSLAIHVSGNEPMLRIAPWFAATIAAAWLSLSCIRAVGLVLAWRRLRSVREQAVPCALEGMEGFNVGARRALLCISNDVDSPTIIGFREPRLLLPAWMAPLLTEDDLRQIALHECEHLRRYDDWLNLLLQVGLVLSPLNPALVWLDRRIATQRELACDAAVVASTEQPIAYATCLTRLAEQRMHHTRLALALAAWGKQSELVQRVQALLEQSAAWSQRQSRLAACATATVLLTGAIGLARAPQLVRIASEPQAAEAVSAPQPAVGDVIPRGLRAVPASFEMMPASIPASRAKRKTAARHKLSLDTVQHAPAVAQRPRVLRASADVQQQPAYRTAELHTDIDSATVRFVTTDFSPSYVAVPVANGWLVFQL